MTKSNKNIARTVGVLFLLQFAIGVSINQFLVGPFTFARNFLSSVSSHSSELIIAMLLGVIDGIISIGIAAMLLQVFRKHSEVLAFTFLAFSILSFITISNDNTSIQSLLTLSREYVKSGAPATGYFQTLGTISYATRLWTHLMTLLVSCFPLSSLYYLLFISRLIPRFISVWGIIGTALMAIAVLSAIFDKGSFMLLYVPIGLNQLFLSTWLIVKGFNSTAIVELPEQIETA